MQKLILVNSHIEPKIGDLVQVKSGAYGVLLPASELKARKGYYHVNFYNGEPTMLVESITKVDCFIVLAESKLNISDQALLNWSESGMDRFGEAGFRFGEVIQVVDRAVVIRNQFDNFSSCRLDEYPDAYWHKIIASSVELPNVLKINKDMFSAIATSEHITIPPHNKITTEYILSQITPKIEPKLYTLEEMRMNLIYCVSELVAEEGLINNSQDMKVWNEKTAAWFHKHMSNEGNN